MREFLGEPDLGSYEVMMVDEAHERTLHTDVLFGLVKDIARFRPEIKLLISSATLDAEKFSEYFDFAPIFRIPGRRYPVDVLYTRQPEADFLDAAVVTVLQIHATQPEGDILVFCTGQEEIETAEETLKQRLRAMGSKVPELVVAPIHESYARTSRPDFPRGVPPGGVVRTPPSRDEPDDRRDQVRHRPGVLQAEELQPEDRDGEPDGDAHEPGERDATRGAGGADEPGEVLSPLHRVEFPERARPEHRPRDPADEPRQRGPDAQVPGYQRPDALRLHGRAPGGDAVAGARTAVRTRPSPRALTKLGRRMAEFPLDPMLSKTLVASDQYGCSEEVATVCCMLSSGNTIWYRPKDKLQLADHAHQAFHLGGVRKDHFA